MIDQIFAERLRQLSPQDLQILDAAITPEVGAVFLKAFPELEPILRPMMQRDQVPPSAPATSAAGGAGARRIPSGGAFGNIA